MKQFLLLACMVLMLQNLQAQVPNITSFSPTSGPVGTTVNISGTNFSPVPADNFVFFGAVRALVNLATTTSLAVTVPAGATYQPITVTSNGLTAYSNYAFVVTFGNNQANFSSSTFATKITLPTSTANFKPTSLGIYDFDGDGKPDISVSSGGLNFYRNTSTGGLLLFGNKITYQVGAYEQYAVGDLNGDGKLDIAAVSGVLTILINTSTVDSISFNVLNIEAGDYRGVAIADLDGDGKPDVMTSRFTSPNQNRGFIYVFKNNSIGAEFSFNEKIEFIVGNASFNLYAGDLNNDSKSDLTILSPFSGNKLLINSSSATSVSFAPAIDVFSGAYALSIGDLNNDSKPDIITSERGRFRVFKNESIPGFFSFQNIIDNPLVHSPKGSTIGDIDGDGKPDIAIAINADTVGIISHSFSLFRNLSNNGNVVLDQEVQFGTENASDIAVGDLNGDGYPEIIITEDASSRIAIYRSQISCIAPIISTSNDIVNDADCGQSNGSILIISESGQLPFQFSIDGGNSYVQGPNDRLSFTNLSPGNYRLRLKDAKGCESIIINKTIKTKSNCNLEPVTIYGLTRTGGNNNYGVLFSYGIMSHEYKELKNFTGQDGFKPSFGFVKGPNQILYGSTEFFGAWRIVSYDPASNTFTALKPMLDGSANSGFVLANNGKFYGTFVRSYSSGLFMYDPLADVYSKVFDFDFIKGNSIGGLTKGIGNLLYGYTNRFLFSFNTETKELKEFYFTTDQNPWGTPLLAKNGKLYGLTFSGGLNNLGVLFSFDPETKVYVKLRDFTSEDGLHFSNMIQAADGKLYGFNYPRRADDKGSIFSFDITSNTYTIRKDFNGQDGSHPAGELMQASDGKLYGITNRGGSNDNGVMFSFDPTNDSYIKLKDFIASDGDPYSAILFELQLNPNCTPPTFLNTPSIVGDASCNNIDGQISIIPTTGTGPFMYSNDGGATYVAGPDAGYTFLNLAPGSYQLRLKDANGCESEVVNKTVITRYGLPTFLNTLAIVGDASCNANDGVISIIPTSGSGPFNYSIDGGATYIKGPYDGYTFLSLAPGNYQLRLMNGNGCESDIVEKSVVERYGQPCPLPKPNTNALNKGLVTEEKSKEEKLKVSVYPNPSRGQFKLQVLQSTPGKAEVFIYDGKGTLVQQTIINPSKGSTVDVNLSGKAKGMYHLKVVTQQGIATSKILLQ